MGRHLLLAAMALVADLQGIGSAAAQSDYPRRAITLIVPFAAGGPTDVAARRTSPPSERAARRAQ